MIFGGIRMKKLLAISAAGVTAVLLFAPAVRAEIVDLLTFQQAVDAAQSVDSTLSAPSNDGKHDFIVGGFIDVSQERVGLSAQSDPLGTNPFGRESVTFPNGAPKIRSKVTCLAVVGNVLGVGQIAAWGTVATSSNSNTLPPGTEFVEFGRDGGPGGTADGWGFAIAPASTCKSFLGQAASSLPILSGDLLIHDEP
jgi:hypothetical protein